MPRRGASLHRDPACRALFDRGAALARERGDVPCGVLHLLAAALESPTTALVGAIPQPTVGYSVLERLRDRVFVAITPTRQRYQTRPAPPDPAPPPPSPFPGRPPCPFPPTPRPYPDPLTPVPRRFPAPPPSPSSSEVPPVLLRYGRDLTAEAEAGRSGR